MPKAETRTIIPHDVMLARLEQFEQMRDFMIQMWLRNPNLAKQAGARVQALLSPIPAAAKSS